jgi:hypothetical protein
MKIGIIGSKWRTEFAGDIFSRLGILSGITGGMENLTVACDIKPGEGACLADFVKNGGNLILLRPEPELLHLFGKPLPYTHSFPLVCLRGNKFPFSFLQVFPNIILIEPENVEITGTFALDLSVNRENRTSRYPAIAWRQFGNGKIGMFFYDIISTILVLQQGREFFASGYDFPPRRYDGAYRAKFLAEEVLDSRLSRVPQAHAHELILLEICRQLAAPASPLPRIWYYPWPNTTVLLLSGDSDGLDPKNLESAWTKVTGWGGSYTQFLMINDLKPFSRNALAKWKDRNIDFGLHYFAGLNPSSGEMTDHFREASELFSEKGLPFVSCRGHSLIWVGWDEQIKIMSEMGMLRSSNLLTWEWGVTQGLPYRLYTKTGSSKVYEIQVFSSDDVTLFDKSGLLPMRPDEALIRMSGALDSMKDLFYQPLNPIFHPTYFTNHPMDTSGWLEGIIHHARNNNIPIMNHAQFFNWWHRRSQAHIICNISGNKVLLEGRRNANGTAIALPEYWNGRKIRCAGKCLAGTGEIIVPIEKQTEVSYEEEL